MSTPLLFSVLHLIYHQEGLMNNMAVTVFAHGSQEALCNVEQFSSDT